PAVAGGHGLFPKDALQRGSVPRLDTLHYFVHLAVEMREADRVRQAAQSSPRRRPNFRSENWIPAFAGITTHRLNVIDQAAPYSPNRVQRFAQVTAQVLDVFDPDRESYQSIVDAERAALSLGNRAVGHQRGMLDQALHAAQAFGKREEAAPFQKALGPCEVSFEPDRHHAAE